MADVKNKWTLEVGTDYTAPIGGPDGLTVDPPLTPAQRDALRPLNYGEYFTPPPPLPYKTVNANGDLVNTFAGEADETTFRIYWKSNVGAVPEDLTQDYMGVRGLDSLGITGHRITVAGGPPGFTPRLYTTTGAQLWAEIGPVPSNPDKVTPTPYLVTIQAVGLGGVSLPSETIPCFTDKPYEPPQGLSPLATPAALNLAGPLPISPVLGSVKLVFRSVFGVSGYQVWDNRSLETAIGMDPARPGLMEYDFQVKTDIPQPAESSWTPDNPERLIYFDTVPSVLAFPFAFKVRAYKTYTDAGGVPRTAFSAFSPPLRGRIPLTPPNP